MSPELERLIKLQDVETRAAESRTRISEAPIAIAALDAKLTAARDRGLPVIVVARPSRPDTETVETAAQALAWLDHAG